MFPYLSFSIYSVKNDYSQALTSMIEKSSLSIFEVVYMSSWSEAYVTDNEIDFCFFSPTLPCKHKVISVTKLSAKITNIFIVFHTCAHAYMSAYVTWIYRFIKFSLKSILFQQGLRCESFGSNVNETVVTCAHNSFST